MREKHWFHFAYYGVLIFFFGIMGVVTLYAFFRSPHSPRVDITEMQRARHEALIAQQQETP